MSLKCIFKVKLIKSWPFCKCSMYLLNLESSFWRKSERDVRTSNYSQIVNISDLHFQRQTYKISLFFFLQLLHLTAELRTVILACPQVDRKLKDVKHQPNRWYQWTSFSSCSMSTVGISLSLQLHKTDWT